MEFQFAIPNGDQIMIDQLVVPSVIDIFAVDPDWIFAPIVP